MSDNHRDYERRFRELVNNKGIEWLISKVPSVVKKKEVVCQDYQSVKPSVAARWHSCTVQNLYTICPCRMKKAK